MGELLRIGEEPDSIPEPELTYIGEGNREGPPSNDKSGFLLVTGLAVGDRVKVIGTEDGRKYINKKIEAADPPYLEVGFIERVAKFPIEVDVMMMESEGTPLSSRTVIKEGERVTVEFLRRIKPPTQSGNLVNKYVKHNYEMVKKALGPPGDML